MNTLPSSSPPQSPWLTGRVLLARYASRKELALGTPYLVEPVLNAAVWVAQERTRYAQVQKPEGRYRLELPPGHHRLQAQLSTGQSTTFEVDVAAHGETPYDVHIPWVVPEGSGGAGLVMVTTVNDAGQELVPPAPAAGVPVRISRTLAGRVERGELIATVTTQEDGWYYVPVPPGDYWADIEWEGTHGSRHLYIRGAKASAATPLELRLQEPQVYPFRTGLGGRVQQWRHEGDTTKVVGLVPVQDALVEVRGPGPEGPTVQVRTNALGRFALPLAPGDYLVRWERQRKQVRVEEGRVSEVELGG